MFSTKFTFKYLLRYNYVHIFIFITSHFNLYVKIDILQTDPNILSRLNNSPSFIILNEFITIFVRTDDCHRTPWQQFTNLSYLLFFRWNEKPYIYIYTVRCTRDSVTYRITYFSPNLFVRKSMDNENPQKKQMFFFFFSLRLHHHFHGTSTMRGRSIFNENPFPLKIHRCTTKIDWFSLF